MTVPQTSPSTRKLSEVARHVVLPSGIESTGWPAVEQRCREFGDKFDEWQRGAGRVILSKRANGEYAATIGGITLSIPRQVAKTWLVGRIVFALCTLFPGLQVIWTAHRTRTATKTFGTLRRFAGRKRVFPYILHIRATNGEQEIAFKNGSVIAFGAREQGFGRGFDEVDIEVFDEAQILTERALEDMVAATNQSRHPHGALLFYMGTPPRPIDPGEAFTTRRREALEVKALRDGGTPTEFDAVYIECSADPDADPDDRKQWAKANPSYPERTPLRSLLRLRKNLVTIEAWLREALGIWDDELLDGGAIPVEAWARQADPDSHIVGKVTFSLDIAPDRSYTNVGISGPGSGGAVHGGIARRDRGTHWHEDYLTRKMAEHDTKTIYVAGGSPAAIAAPELERAGFTVVILNRAEVALACAGLHDDVLAKSFHYTPGQTALDDAVSGAMWSTGDVRVFSRQKSSVDISPLYAIAIARYGSIIAALEDDYDPLANIF